MNGGVSVTVLRLCFRCGTPNAPDQTPAARRRPYTCPRCLAALAEQTFAPAWVDEALEEEVSR
jgi:hypothetical protein